MLHYVNDTVKIKDKIYFEVASSLKVNFYNSKLGEFGVTDGQMNR